MEKKGMTALDLRLVLPELRESLEGGVIKKIYQYGTKSKQFLIEVFKPGTASMLYVDTTKAFLTRTRRAGPKEPPSFCMFLRKYLMGRCIRSVKQYDFDRILEISTEEHVLIFELMPPGNAILCDTEGKIIMPLEIQRWKDREIVPKVPYTYPPAPIDPFILRLDDLLRHFKASDKTVGAFLATGFGFGPLYSSEICARAGVDGGKPANQISLNEVSNIHRVMFSLQKPSSPCIYDDMPSAFPLNVYSNRSCKPAGSFSEALDVFYSEEEVKALEEKEEEKAREVEEKAERITEQRAVAEEKWSKKEKVSRKMAEMINRNYSMVQTILEGITRARKQGMSWKELKEKIQSEATPEAESIKEIREKDGMVVVGLEGMEVELDIRKSPEENAAEYFEGAKWAKKKVGKIKELGPPKVEKVKEVEEKPKKRKRRKWYEKFKWFMTSDGFLVVAGRNAAQNEMLLNKKADPDEPIFHADIQGAAFVLIKKDKKREISDEARKEAAEFAAANSKAWSRGLGKIDIYSVPRSQATKPGGLPKGSFVITGERTWYRDLELKLSVGVKMEKDEAHVTSGPVMAVRKNSTYFVTIKPGFRESGELAKLIKNKILIKASPEDRALIEGVPLEEFEKVIPGGTGEVVDFA